MPASLDNLLVVALSSRALFDFEEENRVFEEQDDRAYMELQLERLEQAAPPGVAFPLVKKLLAFNADGTHKAKLKASRDAAKANTFKAAADLWLDKRSRMATPKGPWRESISGSTSAHWSVALTAPFIGRKGAGNFGRFDQQVLCTDRVQRADDGP